MPNTYTQLFVQIVFAVKGRQNHVASEIRINIEKYVTGIIQQRQHKLMAIYIMPDHAHVFVSMHPNQSLSDLVRDIKSLSSKYINENKLTKVKFAWQEGFGAFTYAKSQVHQVVNYVLNQEQHHKKKSFKEEYIEFLQKFEVKFDEKYLFEFE